MALLGRPCFAVLYLRGPISKPHIFEQRYDIFLGSVLGETLVQTNTIGRLLLSISVPEDQEESRLIGLEVLMAPLGRPRFAVLYLRGPISNPRILEQRYDTFFVMMLFYVDLSPKKLCSKHCFRRSARLGSLFSSPKLPIPLCLRFSICATMTILL